MVVITPEMVISHLASLGIEISRSTLLRYEKQGLIPEPRRGGFGRGAGRWTDYPPETVAEAYAAWKLLHGEYQLSEIILRGALELSPETVGIIRKKYLQVAATGADALAVCAEEGYSEADAVLANILMRAWKALADEARMRIEAAATGTSSA